MKCEFCGGTLFRKNERNGMECSGCGAPNPNIQKLEHYPCYVLSVPMRLSQFELAQIRKAWKDAFENIGHVHVPKIIVLESGYTLTPLTVMK